MAAPPTEKPSRLLDLSAELRNKIYSLLLEDEDSVTIIESSGQHRARDVDRLSSHSNIQPAILRTCRQIYKEASSILYANNALAGDTGIITRVFLERAGDNVRHLRHVEVQYWSKVHPRKSLLILKRATALQRLEFNFGLTEEYTSAQFAKDIGPLMRALHKARQRLKGYHVSSVLDVVVVGGGCNDFTTEKAQTFEREVKELVGGTLK